METKMLTYEEHLDMEDKLEDIHVREWYMDAYPTDECGKYINKHCTLADVYDCLFVNKRDVYYVLAECDSVIRERVFGKLARETGMEYGEIYDAWLAGY